MESALQETPMDLSVRADRGSADSTGSKSPRSEVSWDMSKCSRDTEDDDDDMEVVDNQNEKIPPKDCFHVIHVEKTLTDQIYWRHM